MRHYVYKLFNGAQLVYVGRALRPKDRLSYMRRVRRNQRLTLVVVRGPMKFAMAQALELRLIKELRPAWNKNNESSPGRLGRTLPVSLRSRLREKLRGRRFTKLHRARLRESSAARWAR